MIEKIVVDHKGSERPVRPASPPPEPPLPPQIPGYTLLYAVDSATRGRWVFWLVMGGVIVAGLLCLWLSSGAA